MGFGEMGDFPNWNLPSALAVAKQGYSFLFAYGYVSFKHEFFANKKRYSCGQIWFLRMPECSCEMDCFYLSETLLIYGMASSKNNENTVPISGGCVGCGGYFT